MNTQQRIEDNPSRFAELKVHVENGNHAAGCRMMNGDLTIDEATVRSLGEPFEREARLMLGAYEAQLGHSILIPTPRLHANLSGHARCTYAVRHWDMLEDFPRVVDALERHQRSVTCRDVSPEFFVWAEDRLGSAAFAARVSKLIDFTKREN